MASAELLLSLLMVTGLAGRTIELAEMNDNGAGDVNGCYGCAYYRCPSDPAECLLGAIPDACDCCGNGICARLDGESCWNASIHELPKWKRNEGECAGDYVCRLRNDLEPEDIPEATCVCRETDQACGTNERTYPSLCALNEDARRQPHVNLTLNHLGPCTSPPIIYSAPDNVIDAEFGRTIVLGCEAKGYPLPDVFWEFHSADGERVLRLPYDELEDGVVNNSESLGTLMRTSWLQLERLQRFHLGTYHCVANNSAGQASAFSIVSVD